MAGNDDLFAGRVAVVTGASTGIGLGLSRKLLESGAEVYLSSRTPAHIAAAAESLRSFGDRSHSQVLDVRDQTAVRDYVDYVAARGPIDFLFCNAGVGFGQPYQDTRREDWDTVFDVNVFGVVNCVHHALPHLRRQGQGHIVITSSVAGFSPLPYQSIYVASKHAVLGFARALAYEVEDERIEVSVVCPGAVATNIFSRSLDYVLHPGLPVPEGAIGIDQAGQEILDGLRAGLQIIPVNDDARQLWRAARAGDGDYLDMAMRHVRKTQLEAMAARSVASVPSTGGERST